MTLTAEDVLKNLQAQYNRGVARRARRARKKQEAQPIGKKKRKAAKRAERNQRKRQRRSARKKAKAYLVKGYAAYLASPMWKAKRREAIKHYGAACQGCGFNEKLNVHHKHYRTLGVEAMDDLEVLCEACHELRHEDKVFLSDPLSARFREFVSSMG